MDYNSLREEVLQAAREGRATFLPAGARHNATAQIFVDGKLVGQASGLMHYVRVADDAPQFGESALVPGYDHQIPDRLR
jgi:hypothetical protein